MYKSGDTEALLDKTLENPQEKRTWTPIKRSDFAQYVKSVCDPKENSDELQAQFSACILSSFYIYLNNNLTFRTFQLGI